MKIYVFHDYLYIGWFFLKEKKTPTILRVVIKLDEIDFNFLILVLDFLHHVGVLLEESLTLVIKFISCVLKIHIYMFT